MNRPAILKQDWHTWKQDPITKALVYDLVARREMHKDGWVNGRYENKKETYIALGRGQEVIDLLEYILHSFQVVEDNSQEETSNAD